MNLVARAQELLDQRQDPLEDHDLLAALEDCTDALEEVIALRAIGLQLAATAPATSTAASSAPVPATASWPHRWWIAPLAAAAALAIMLLPPQESVAPEISLQASSTAVSAAAAAPAAPATSAILRLEQHAQTTALSPAAGGDLIAVSITTSHTVRT